MKLCECACVCVYHFCYQGYQAAVEQTILRANYIQFIVNSLIFMI